MKVLNEKGKKLRQIAMMNLNVGNEKEKEVAKKFLKDIGLSDESIDKIEGKKKEKVEENFNENVIWKLVKNLPDGMMEIKTDSGDKGFIHADKVIVKNGIVTWKKNIEESLNEECDCQKCSPEKHSSCSKPTKKCKKDKEMVGEEMIADKINSVDMAQSALKAKKIMWTKTEKIGNKTVWKSGDAIVGAFNLSWGTVRTGEDLIKENDDDGIILYFEKLRKQGYKDEVIRKKLREKFPIKYKVIEVLMKGLTKIF